MLGNALTQFTPFANTPPTTINVKQPPEGCPFFSSSPSNEKTPQDDFTYQEYLALDQLLDCQNPKSASHGNPVHEETLFIIIHQTYELWFKQIIHDLDSVLEILGSGYLEDRRMSTIISRLERTVKILSILNSQIAILETMSPQDFLEFRGYLSSASGFQSLQFRLLENKLGLRPTSRVQYQRNNYKAPFNDKLRESLEISESSPSLFTMIERWLERTPFLTSHEFSFLETYKDSLEKTFKQELDTIESSTTLTAEEKETRLKMLNDNRDSFATITDPNRYQELCARGERRFSHRAMQAALLINLYRHEPILQLPYRLLSVLMDIDEGLMQWRYNHSAMVQRMVGSKMGTGGSQGFFYLRSTVSTRYKVFSDLFYLSNYLLPSSALQPLPESLKRLMSFSSGV